MKRKRKLGKIMVPIVKIGDQNVYKKVNYHGQRKKTSFTLILTKNVLTKTKYSEMESVLT